MKKIKIKKPRNLILMNEWQSGRMRTKIIPNKKKKIKKFNWKKEVADSLNIKNNNLVLKQSAIL